jgi:hypothetical protein
MGHSCVEHLLPQPSAQPAFSNSADAVEHHDGQRCPRRSVHETLTNLNLIDSVGEIPQFMAGRAGSVIERSKISHAIYGRRKGVFDQTGLGSGPPRDSMGRSVERTSGANGGCEDAIPKVALNWGRQRLPQLASPMNGPDTMIRRPIGQ